MLDLYEGAYGQVVTQSQGRVASGRTFTRTGPRHEARQRANHGLQKATRKL